MLWGIPTLVHIEAVVPLAGCLEGFGPHNGYHLLFPKSGGMEDESTASQYKFLDHVVNNHIILVRSQYTVSDMLSVIPNFLFEESLYKFPIVCPECTNSGPMCGFQVLINLTWSGGSIHMRLPSCGECSNNTRSYPQTTQKNRISCG